MIRQHTTPIGGVGRFSTSLFIVLVLATSSTFAAEGTPWALKMFEETSHDFGVVAKGADVRYAFEFENIYQEDVHIARVSSSCGCTSTEFTQEPVKMHEKGEVLAVIDTRSFSKQKGAKLTVEIDEPYPATVELEVHVYIRPDVVVEPGQVEFGTVAKGQAVSQPLTLSYAGRQNWAITRIETVSPYIYVTAREATRVPSSTPGVYNISYDVAVSLRDDAPEGYIKEPITFITNDPVATATRVVVPVQGIVVPSVSVHPSPVLLGQIHPGETITRNLVVRAGAPFSITHVTCDGVDNPQFQFAFASAPKTIQLIMVTFTAGATLGKVAQDIRIDTDLASENVLHVTAEGHIVQSETANQPAPLPTGIAPTGIAPTGIAPALPDASGWQPAGAEDR